MINSLRAWLRTRPWAERLQLGAAWFLQLAILGVLIGSLIESQWLVAFTAAAVLALTFLPAVIERQLSVQLPVEFTLVNTVFLYAAFGLGEVRQFYARYWWWDLLLHSFSALVMGLIGFLLVYVFYSTHRIRMAPGYVALSPSALRSHSERCGRSSNSSWTSVSDSTCRNPVWWTR